MRAQMMAGPAGLLMAVAACSGSADPNLRDASQPAAST